jgi:uncharacterized protein (DUF1778 family)
MKSARLELRLPAALKKRVEKAATLLGLTTTEFTKKALEEKAEQICQDQQLLVLAEEDRDRLLAALASPPKPVPALQEAFQWYEEIHERKRVSRKSGGRKPRQGS